MTSLYRSCLRAIRQLPDLYLRHFFRLKFADDVRVLCRTCNTHGLRDRKLGRIQRELCKINAAVNGNSDAFAHVLDVAYGRKGKLRRELIEPLLSNPKLPQPSRIIAAVEKSHPPVYSEELAALLTSGVSRPAGALSRKKLVSPHLLPARADPSSEEARLLGRISKRREVNFRWRFFTEEAARVLLPIQVEVKGSGSTKDDAVQAGIRYFGLQGMHLREHIETIAGPANLPVSVTRRERRNNIPLDTTTPPPAHPSRWLRRRYRQLLARLPILTYAKDTRKYDVSYPHAVLRSSSNPNNLTSQFVQIDPVNLAWVDSAETRVKK